jgi:hypothetical protein
VLSKAADELIRPQIVSWDWRMGEAKIGNNQRIVSENPSQMSCKENWPLAANPLFGSASTKRTTLPIASNRNCCSVFLSSGGTRISRLTAALTGGAVWQVTNIPDVLMSRVRPISSCFVPD